ncbi:MAG: DUF4388 domain-containing protein [Blastocatellia bacterium]
MGLSEENNEAALPDIFEMYCAGHQNARLTVNYPGGDGVFYFENGELIEARLGDLTGEEAFRQAARLPREAFRVDLDVAVPPRAIFTGWADLMDGVEMEAEMLTERNVSARLQPVIAEKVEAASVTAATPDSSFPAATAEREQPRQAELRRSARPDQAATDKVSKSAAEVQVRSVVNQSNPPTASPAPPAAVVSADDHRLIQQALAATGVMQSGLIIDEDGVVVSELGDSDATLAQTAFMVAGLESLVSALFDLGPCEGALLDHNGAATMVTRANGLSCAFVPVPRTPVARAFNEARRALEQSAGGQS